MTQHKHEHAHEHKEKKEKHEMAVFHHPYQGHMSCIVVKKDKEKATIKPEEGTFPKHRAGNVDVEEMDEMEVPTEALHFVE